MSSIADEIDRLAAQRDAGQLTDAEFEAAKARVLAAAGSPRLDGPPVGGRLRRSLSDRWIGGVCGGIAKSMGIESWIVRLVFALAVLSAGVGLLPYALLWLLVPLEGT